MRITSGQLRQIIREVAEGSKEPSDGTVSVTLGELRRLVKEEAKVVKGSQRKRG